MQKIQAGSQEFGPRVHSKRTQSWTNPMESTEPGFEWKDKTGPFHHRYTPKRNPPASAKTLITLTLHHHASIITEEVSTLLDEAQISKHIKRKERQIHKFQTLQTKTHHSESVKTTRMPPQAMMTRKSGWRTYETGSSLNQKEAIQRSFCHIPTTASHGGPHHGHRNRIRNKRSQAEAEQMSMKVSALQCNSSSI